MLNFEPISLEKQKLYHSYFEKTPEQSADYTFVNLYGLKDMYSLEWAFTENLVWIRQRSPYTIYWAPVGDWSKETFCKAPNDCIFKSQMLIRIPKTLALMLKESSCMEIKEERDEWEYLYSTEELIELKGNRFHKKKNLANQFERNDYEYKDIDSSMVNAILEFEEKWEETEKSLEQHTTTESQVDTNNDEENNNTNDSTDNSDNVESFDKAKMITHEVRSEADILMIKCLLKNWDKIDNIKGGALLIDNKIVAYTIACKSMRDTIVVHAERGDRYVKGSYQAINRIFLRKIKDDNYKFVNREQDVGDEGLRKAKLSYNPIGFLEKYSGYSTGKK